MYCNESYLPDLPSTRQTVSWLYDVIIIPNMHLNNFNNNSDITAKVTLGDGEDDDDVLVTDASFDKMIYVKVSGCIWILTIELEKLLYKQLQVLVPIHSFLNTFECTTKFVIPVTREHCQRIIGMKYDPLLIS